MLLNAAAAVAVSPVTAQIVAPGAANADADASAPSDHIGDTIHGVRVQDPFRPLEDSSRAEVQAWIAAEDGKAHLLLTSNSLHSRVSDFLRASGHYPRTSGLRRMGRSFVSWAFDGTKEHSWLEIRDAIGDATQATPMAPSVYRDFIPIAAATRSPISRRRTEAMPSCCASVISVPGLTYSTGLRDVAGRPWFGYQTVTPFIT
jgi:hypothetical protein